MVYPRRLSQRGNLKAEEVEKIEDILWSQSYLDDISYHIERKTGKRLEELE